MPDTNQPQTKEVYPPNTAVLRQRHIRTRKDLENLQNKIFGPSIAKYLFLGLVGLIGDLCDFLSLTGVGYFVSVLIDIVIGAILLIGGINAKSKINNLKEVSTNLEKHLGNMMKRWQQTRTYYARSIKYARKVPGMRKGIRKAALALRKVRMVITRSPVAKNLIAIVSDLVPLLEFGPWRTIGVWLTYKDEKNAYEETMVQIKETQLQAAEIANEELVMLQAVQEEQLAA